MVKCVRKRGRPKQDPEQRRRQIMTAAVDVYAERGYHEASLTLVAERLGIVKGTIYLYYRSKKELFLAVVEHGACKLEMEIARAVERAAGPVEGVRAVVGTYFRFFYRDRRLAEVVVREQGKSFGYAQEAYYRILERNRIHMKSFLLEGIERRVFRRVDIDQTADILANLLTGMVYTYMLGYKRGRTTWDVNAITDFILHGIAADGAAV